MKRVLRTGRDVKARRSKVEEILNNRMNLLEMDTKIQLIQELIPLGLLYVQDLLEEEVRQLAGERYKRNGIGGYNRWGMQWGSVYVGYQKIPIYQRVRDRQKNKEVKLRSYEELQSPGGIDDSVFKKVLHGITCRRYKESCEMIPEVFGLSSSMVSRRFVRASKRKLKELRERRLDNLDIKTIIIDGKTFKEDSMIIALGITLEGEKVILGFIQRSEERRVGKECRSRWSAYQ